MGREKKRDSTLLSANRAWTARRPHSDRLAPATAPRRTVQSKTRRHDACLPPVAARLGPPNRAEVAVFREYSDRPCPTNPTRGSGSSNSSLNLVVAPTSRPPPQALAAPAALNGRRRVGARTAAADRASTANVSAKNGWLGLYILPNTSRLPPICLRTQVLISSYLYVAYIINL